MTVPGDPQDDRFIVEIGGERFDPKIRASFARRRANAGKKKLAQALGVAVDELPADREACLVQFEDGLDVETVGRIQDEYGLRMKRGPSRLLFVELIDKATADRVRRDPAVRSCIRYWPELKLARSSFSPGQQPSGTRTLQIGLFEDLSDNLLALIERLGGQTLGPASTYPGGHLLRVNAPPTLDPEVLLLLDGVEWVDEVRGYLQCNGSSASVAQSGGAAGSNPIWAMGLHGEKQILGIFDGDLLDLTHDFFNDPNVPTPGPNHRKVLAVRSQAGPIAFHPTRVAGCAVGDDVNAPGSHPDRGGAWAAKMVYHDFDPVPPIGAELAASAALGARVLNFSISEPLLDDDTKPAPYTTDSTVYDDFLWRHEDLLLVTAVTNTPACLDQPFAGAPATAKNPLTVAGTQDFPNHNSFHTGNPGTSDGRRKPDLVAVGENVRSSSVTAPPNSPRDSGRITLSCGTSFAAPHVAAAAALIRQYFREGWFPSGALRARNAIHPSGALLKAMLLNATVELAGTPDYPSPQAGWGRLQLDRTLFFAGDNRTLNVWDIRHAEGLTRNGSKKFFPLKVPANAKSLKVTLVFNDPAGAKGEADPVVNKLDIEAMEPRGIFDFDPTKFGYFGNALSGGLSVRHDFNLLPSSVAGLPVIPNPDHSELKNNVRQVVVDAPIAGNWALNVRAHRIHSDTPLLPPRSQPTQGYALVACVELD